MLTYQHFRNRFDYAKRDVLKRITVKTIKKLKPDRKGEPLIFYRIESSSYPNYPPYFDKKKGRKYQRKVKHRYDFILEMDRLSLNTTHWKLRLGSGRKWIKNPPQNKVKTVYKRTREKWEKQSLRKGKTKKAQKEWLQEKIQKHKAKARYLDVGDFNSQVNGINGDALFYLNFALKTHGHLYGYNHGSDIPAPVNNPSNRIFFPKHVLNILEVLMRKGVITDN